MIEDSEDRELADGTASGTSADRSRTTIVAYGSLCSGLGLQGFGRMPIEHIERVQLENCRRGFGKLSQHGDRYAMVLEPLRSDEPIQVDSDPAVSAGNVHALALTVTSEDLGRISRREGYDPAVLHELERAARRQGLTLGQHLWRILESVGFSLGQYRRRLFERTGYTSSHYIPHPVARAGEDPALVFLAPGPEGSGDESVIPVRVATGMVDVLSVHQAWQYKSNPSQIEYFAMCVIAQVHGVSFADVLNDLEPASELAARLSERLRSEEAWEPARFCSVLGLSTEGYGALRNGPPSGSWLFETGEQPA